MIASVIPGALLLAWEFTFHEALPVPSKSDGLAAVNDECVADGETAKIGAQPERG